MLHSQLAVVRLLTMFGGFTPTWGSASFWGGLFASEMTYGTLTTGNTRNDLPNARFIIMWGWNPAESIQITTTSYFMTLAKEAGVKIVAVDPRFTDSAAAFASQWIPIRPGTDTAMLMAMAYVMIKENLQDQKFLDTYTIGFEQFRDYVTGRADGIQKTPAWAEEITGVPAATIAQLAREYATLKPAKLLRIRRPGPHCVRRTVSPCCSDTCGDDRKYRHIWRRSCGLRPRAGRPPAACIGRAAARRKARQPAGGHHPEKRGAHHQGVGCHP